MPELPEVETITRRLKDVLPGRMIERILQLHPKPFQGAPEHLVGAVIESVTRKAKQIRIKLNNHYNLLIHLKMTGQLIFVDHGKRVGGGHPTADWVSELPSKHTRCHFQFTDGSSLFFNDQRIFGWIKVLTHEQLDSEWAALTPDITDPQVTTEYLEKKWQRRNQMIKLVLLDTSVSNGLGNIYVCDALFEARISPFRLASSLSRPEVQALHAACQAVIHEGIQLGGTTFDGLYVNVEGFAGGYQNVARVYKRQGLPCLRCGTLIEKRTIGGRGTYFCPVCQI
jgi:formamidopyrimidine-DNA glycosylase